MTRLVDLTIALSSYDHTLDLKKGAVGVAGTRPNFVELPIAEMFRRFLRDRDWDVSEIPLLEYAMLRDSGDDGILAIPVFTSRIFQHSSIYVRGDQIREPADLRGARVGIPAWTDSAGVWARGLLSDMYGLCAEQIEWWQGGLDRPARPAARDKSKLPAGVKLQPSEDRSLEQMLWAGELDALIASRVPASLETSIRSDGLVRRLFGDLIAAERAYYETTRCLPPMHTIGIRRELVEAHPWLLSNLYRAFEVSKRRYFVRLSEISASRTAIPWTSAYLAGAQTIFGEDLWPYGVDDNRASLETFLRYGDEQALFAARFTAEELFAPVEPFVDGLV